jgi:hypothetical protein
LKYEEKQYPQSIESLQLASNIYPNKVEPYFYQGIIHIQTSIANK